MCAPTVAQLDMHTSRRLALNRRDHSRIKAELHNVACLGRARQLGIHRFVRPVAKVGRLLDPDQKIGKSTPRRLQKRGLKDSLRALLHGLPRQRCATFQRAFLGYFDKASLIRKLLTIGILIFKPGLLHKLTHGVVFGLFRSGARVSQSR